MDEANLKNAMSKEIQLLRAEEKSLHNTIYEVREAEEAVRTKIYEETEALIGAVEKSQQMQEELISLQNAANSEKINVIKKRIDKALEIKDFESIKKMISEI